MRKGILGVLVVVAGGGLASGQWAPYASSESRPWANEPVPISGTASGSMFNMPPGYAARFPVYAPAPVRAPEAVSYPVPYYPPPMMPFVPGVLPPSGDPAGQMGKPPSSDMGRISNPSYGGPPPSALPPVSVAAAGKAVAVSAEKESQKPSPESIPLPKQKGVPPTAPKANAAGDRFPFFTEPYLLSAPPHDNDDDDDGPPGPPRFPRGCKFYGGADYLLWWTPHQQIPAVATVGGSTLASQAPILANDPRSGVRGFLGVWVTPRIGLEGSYFILEQQGGTSATTVPDSTLAALPLFTGITSQVTTVSRFWGAEANLRYKGCCLNCGSAQLFVDGLAGFRYLDLSEGLADVNNLQFAGTAPGTLAGASANTLDLFGTHNHFYGGQVGADANLYWWRLHLNMYGKMALGDNVQSATLTGLTNGSPVGGLLVQPSNAGTFSRDRFSYVPELGMNVGYRVTQFCEFGVGYTFIYWGNIVRPGGQAPQGSGGTGGVPPSLLATTPPAPTFRFHESGFWAQGLNFRVLFVF